MDKGNIIKQTAYQHNSHSHQNIEQKDHGWAKAINCMINQRYAFLDLAYNDDGYLFRGMRSGTLQALEKMQFWFNEPAEEPGLEEELDVIFFSQDISDALSFSRLWDTDEDACILVIKAQLFNQALQNKQACMMATAEPGVVFKYPLLTRPLVLEEISLIIISPEFMERIVDEETDQATTEKMNVAISILQKQNKLLILDFPNEPVVRRAAIEKQCNDRLAQYRITAAIPEKNNLKPGRIS